MLTDTISSFSPGLKGVLALVSLLLINHVIRRQRFAARSKGFPFPPGPPSLPVLGNVAEVKGPDITKRMLEYKAQYGS